LVDSDDLTFLERGEGFRTSPRTRGSGSSPWPWTSNVAAATAGRRAEHPGRELMKQAVAMVGPGVEIIAEPLGLKPVAAAWNGLADRFQTPLLRHEWFAACAEAFCPPDRLHTVMVRRGGDVTGMPPLVKVSPVG